MDYFSGFMFLLTESWGSASGPEEKPSNCIIVSEKKNLT